jgi:hypothetical protein
MNGEEAPKAPIAQTIYNFDISKGKNFISPRIIKAGKAKIEMSKILVVIILALSSLFEIKDFCFIIGFLPLVL